MRVERETLGVELYGIQQQLAHRQMLMESEQEKHTTLHQLRVQREETLAQVREMYRSMWCVCVCVYVCVICVCVCVCECMWLFRVYGCAFVVGYACMTMHTMCSVWCERCVCVMTAHGVCSM